MPTADAHSDLGWHDAAGRQTKTSLQGPVIALKGVQRSSVQNGLQASACMIAATDKGSQLL
jgi:hypothetical protein